MNKTAETIMQKVDIVLIDTWWNVNYDKNGAYFTFGRVLIDTWWNVNVGRIAEFYGADGVLIDTWWNVNHGKRIAFCNSS